MLDPIEIWYNKMLNTKRKLVQTNFGSKKIWVKKIWVKKSLVMKDWFEKKMWSKKTLCPKNLWGQKIFILKKSRFKNILGLEKFKVQKDLRQEKKCSGPKTRTNLARTNVP